MNDDVEQYQPQDISVYEFLCREAGQYRQHTAISFYGRKFTYQELFAGIDRVAAALTAYGIGKDDVVASSLPGTPEGIFLLYAINKIGAIYCAFDCRCRNEEIRQTIETFHPKLCFIPDFQVKDFKGIHDQAVVHLNPARSVGRLVKLTSLAADFFTGRDFVFMGHKNLIGYDDFLDAAAPPIAETSVRNGSDTFGYFYTSGTTYGRKSIILTNENLNAAVIQQRQANPLIAPGNTILNIMPLFTCYSVTLAVHLPLICGVSVNLIPLINTKKLKALLLREKPNFIITVPAHWEHFIKEDFRSCDLSFLKGVIVGGDTMNTRFKNTVNDIFRRCGCQQPLIIGYGLSETTSTTAATVIPSPPGSVGRPFAYTQIGIFDKDTGQPLPPNAKGEICVRGPTVCRGYFNDPEMTSGLLQKHSDGKIWLHSGDIGYLDRNGALFFCERIKRMYVRFDGTKISPYSIEQFISTCPLVARCMVVAIPDREHSHGMCAQVLVVLRDNVRKRDAKERLEHFFRKNLDQHMIPKEVVIVDRLPYTKNGKLDYFRAASAETNADDNHLVTK